VSARRRYMTGIGGGLRRPSGSSARASVRSAGDWGRAGPSPPHGGARLGVLGDARRLAARSATTRRGVAMARGDAAAAARARGVAGSARGSDRAS